MRRANPTEATDGAGFGRLALRHWEGRRCGVPWCETCDRYYNPSSIAPDGTCVKCGSFIADTSDVEDDDNAKIPWHFWVLVVALIVYLGWRFIQLMGWLIN